MHKFKIEAIKFTLVGGANFALTFIVFTAMLKVLALNYLLSLAAAWVVGMLFSYVLNFSWVFKPEQKVQFRARFFRFFLASVLSIALNMLVLRYIVERTDFDPFYVQMALIPFIVVFNFSTAKFWSLRSSSDGKLRELSLLKIREKKYNLTSFYRLLKIESVAKTGILLCTFLVIVYCVWTLNCGFEITEPWGAESRCRNLLSKVYDFSLRRE